MSGFVKNDWNRFLNGGTSQYNFSYRSDAPPTPPEPIPTPVPIPSTAPVPSNVAKSHIRDKKTNKVVIPPQKGGKRKATRRRAKKHRNTRRK